MIKRFEDEYPETRLPSTITSPPLPDHEQLPPDQASPTDLELSLSRNDTNTSADADLDPTHFDEAAPPSEDEDAATRPILSRHNSDVSLASRALSQEEGRMHRFGQQFRREILKPEQADHLHATTGLEDQPRHLQMLRAMVEGLGGEEIKDRINEQGTDAVLEELSNEASVLRERLMEQDPEGWEKFRESQEAAVRNQRLAGLERNVSAIE